MDTINYILFKNPVVTYSWSTAKNLGTGIAGTVSKAGSLTGAKQSTPIENNIVEVLRMNRNFLRLSGALGVSAVIIGAYGAHTLLAKETSEHRKKVFETASHYHFYHVLALLSAPFAKFPKITALTFTSGIIIFCGSCYYQSLTGDTRLGKITPYGGSLLIIAWLTLLL